MFKLSKMMIVALISIPGFCAAANAQSAPSGQLGVGTEQVFNIQDLTSRQGLINISPNYQVLLEFPDLVDEVAFNNPLLVQYTVPKGGETRLYLNALKSTGYTDMIVIVAGKSLLFRVTINSNAYNGTRKYTVRAPTVDAQPAPAPTVNAAAIIPSLLPANFRISMTPAMVPNGGVNIPYQLINGGLSNVLATRDNLSVYSLENGNRVNQSIKLSRTSTSVGGIVSANATEVGLISLSNPSLPTGELFVEWKLVEQSSRKSFLYKVRIDLVNGTAEVL